MERSTQDRNFGPTTVVGIFDSVDFARDAVRELVEARFPEDQLGLLAPSGTATDTHEATTIPTEGRAANVAAGATAGIAAGASVGALWAIGIAAGLLPAIGPVIAGGLLASVLASAAGGAAVAGVVGALIGLGVPEEEARYYESEFQAGRTLVTVRAPADRSEEAKGILRRHGAYDVHTKDTYQATPEYRRKLADVSTVDYFPVQPGRPR
ncbi:MAG: hypothetical protein JNG90_03990 [Planctomycetaceae bacterium]|nr:hypothetical protein [Planctomycetaceae bacterium]